MKLPRTEYFLKSKYDPNSAAKRDQAEHTNKETCSYMTTWQMLWRSHSEVPQESWRRRWWHPTPVLLPGKSHGWRSLVGCSPWGRKESDATERLPFHFSLSCIGEGNGNPLQCSCLEDFPGKNTRVGCHFLLQGIFPTQGWNPCLQSLLRWQTDSSPLSHLRSPFYIW